LIGNPQNILIGQAGGIGFWPYFADAVIPSLVGLAVSFGCIALVWRTSLSAPAGDAPLAKITFNRLQTGICGRGRSSSRSCDLTAARGIALLVAACLILVVYFPQDNTDEIDLPLLILFAALFIERCVCANRFQKTPYVPSHLMIFCPIVS
jgi:Na+/H+ antiporter NhaD/arsenite permease-like protein